MVEPRFDFDDLNCPNCDYSLRGLSETRCPECGLIFQPGILRARLARSWRCDLKLLYLFIPHIVAICVVVRYRINIDTLEVPQSLIYFVWIVFGLPALSVGIGLVWLLRLRGRPAQIILLSSMVIGLLVVIIGLTL